jgi:poly-gamma-glutamate capsule biosynthesis protein CapA/YwtB (metallophosphatase superfamily)
MRARFFLVGLTGGLVLLSTVLPRAPGTRVARGVRMEGVSLGGLSEGTARKALTEQGAGAGKRVILAGAHSWAIPARALGVELDAGASARRAVQVGTDGTPLRRWCDLLAATWAPGGVAARYRVEVPQARVALRRLSRRVDREPHAAAWERGEGGVRLRIHWSGRMLDVEATLNRLQQEAARGLRRPVAMTTVQVEPRLTAQALQDATEQLGEARAMLRGGARWANVRAGLRALGGRVLHGGSTLSACEELLPLSPGRGFRFASDEQGEVALGGGVEICLKLLATAAGRAGLVTSWRELRPELAALLPLRSDLLVASGVGSDVVILAGCDQGYGWVRVNGGQPPGATPRLSAAGPKLGGITVALVGDLLPTTKRAEVGPVGALTAKAEVAFANLECPISSRGAPLKAKQAPNEWAFRAPPPAAREQMRAWGLDVVSLANNHALDYGPLALADTLTVLRGQGIQHGGADMAAAGAWQPAIIERQGLGIGFVCCVASETLPGSGEFEAGASHPGLAVLRTDGVRLAQACRRLAAQVRELRWRVDLLIVSMHWGEEAVGTPTPIQRELARAAAEAGADIVVGHHPHRLQPLELAHSGECIVAYSLGNFVFPAQRAAQRHSGVLLVRWGPRGIIAAGFAPAKLEGGEPSPVTDADLRRQIAQELLGATG